MAEQRGNIPVKVGDQHKYGTFANAFRIVEEVGADCFLDFMVYSSEALEATVVSRIRVRREFLGNIRTQLGSALINLGVISADDAAEEGVPFRKTGESVH